MGHLCVQHLRTCFASGTLGPGQAGTLISGLKRYWRLARSCGADLEDHQPVLPNVVAGASMLVPCYPNRIQNTSISRDRLECGSVRLVPKRPRTLSFDAPFISLRPAEARQLRWMMVRRKDF